MVLPGYFAAMAIPLISGRAIESTDRTDSEPVIVLSESTARHLFGDANPIGRAVHAMESRDRVTRTVVGVAGDVVLGNPAGGANMAMYFPDAQVTRPQMRLAIRIRGDAGTVVEALRRIIRELDRNVPLDDVRTMDQAVTSTVADRRGTMAVVVGFAATALVLAGVGLYGVLAFRVSLRLREIGIRMALGATSRTVTTAVARDGLVLIATGLDVGSVAALVVGRLMHGMLFAIDGHDPITFAALTLVLCSTGALACTLPARRAARISPTDVMRTE